MRAQYPGRRRRSERRARRYRVHSGLREWPRGCRRRRVAKPPSARGEGRSYEAGGSTSRPPGASRARVDSSSPDWPTPAATATVTALIAVVGSAAAHTRDSSLGLRRAPGLRRARDAGPRTHGPRRRRSSHSSARAGGPSFQARDFSLERVRLQRLDDAVTAQTSNDGHGDGSGSRSGRAREANEWLEASVWRGDGKVGFQGAIRAASSDVHRLR